MRILAPVNAPAEVAPLARAGADEFYCGIVPDTWTERFSRIVPLNRRDAGMANLSDFAHLRALVAAAHQHSCPVYLTLNAQTYTADQLPLVFDTAAAALDSAGVDGLIVADPGIIRALTGWRPGVRLHLSSLASAHNIEAVRFFRDLGVKRLILPRQVGLAEVAGIIAAVPDVEVEVFVLNDGCIYEEGHCSTSHGIGPFCLTEWDYEFRSLGARGSFTPAERAKQEENIRDYRQFVLQHEAFGPFATPSGFPAGPCGLCAIPDLFASGVRALKVVGREAETHRKVMSVRMVRAVLDHVGTGADPAQARRFARELRQTPDVCARGWSCYYPEVVHREAAGEGVVVPP